MTPNSTVLFWFRRDLRLHDQLAMAAALNSGATHLVPVLCQPNTHEMSRWGFTRKSSHRHKFETTAVRDLASQLGRLGNSLRQCQGSPAKVLPALATALGATAIFCEEIAAPYEQAEVAMLRAAGLNVQTVWQSSLLRPSDLPWPAASLPSVFTTFRRAVEQANITAPMALPAPLTILPPPQALSAAVWQGLLDSADALNLAEEQTALSGVKEEDPVSDWRSSFPYRSPACDGGEAAALAHLQWYLDRQLPHTYDATRNGLTGFEYSSKFSPWLATGALSARHVMAQLRGFEQAHGANKGTYWLWYELLWRDYFRLLHLQHGVALYRARGLSSQPPPTHVPSAFARWCQGDTGEPLVDAAMRELRSTGYLSNRLRQVAASYLIYDLQCDWRAGAAWFESQLLDYDPYSNQGNWLYIAGRGTDPRGGRRFNPVKQAQEHDPDGSYRRLWGTA